MSFWLVVLLFSFLTVGIDTVSSLKCYACEDPLGLDKDCEDNVKDIQSIECGEVQVCGQFVREMPDTKILHRGCYPPDVCTLQERELANAPEVNLRDCKTCSEDLCNGDAPNGSEKAVVSFILVFCVLSTLVFSF